ncbi:hypothetical protein RI129_004849 [Pyrocoelia pectoralis]|uniref:Mitochondrial pyruvate carrier n=1 Tax=Pyrocoelia pectoralis TaxID=417401 RepID=A0AAN7ZH38_9COLE
MSSIYRKSMLMVEKVVPKKFLPFWNHPAGPKTVFFWAPTVKGGLVIAGISDLARPADKLSMPQTISLASSGFIWSRNSLVIIPKNYYLFCVNLFVGTTQLYQLVRAFRYQQSLKDGDSKAT